MMDTHADQAVAELRDGFGIDTLLTMGAVLALVGWGATQFLASAPGVALETVGVESTILVVAIWIVASTLIAAAVLVGGAPAVIYSPLLWVWGVLVALALAVDGAVILGLVPPGLGRTLLWTPWPIVIGLGFLATGLLASHRRRGAYLVGSLAAGLVVLAAVLFPSTVPDWAFAATGVVHAVPLLVDARTGTGDAAGTTTGDAANSTGQDGIAAGSGAGSTPDLDVSSYEFRDLQEATTPEDASGGGQS